MIKKSLPGERSNIALLVTSTWAIISLFIIIIGHLVIAFFAYGKYTGTDALSELADYLPVLETPHLYMIAGLAVIADIWIIISQKKARDYKIKR